MKIFLNTSNINKPTIEITEVFINTNEVFIYTESQRDFENKYFLYENDDAMHLIGSFRTLKETKEFAKKHNLIITN